MRKLTRFCTLLLTLALLLSFAATANAASNVTYVEKSGKFIFSPGSNQSPTDLFGNLKNVMPGDTITEQIRIVNDKSNRVKINVYLRSKGAQEGTDEFLSQLNLAVRQEEDYRLYAGPADETGDLTDWVFLGTVYSGGEITLNLTLDVPITMGNEFQNQVGYIDWEFSIVELPVDPSDPKTGDTSNVYFYAGVMAVSFTALLFLLLAKRRKEKEENA